MKRLITILLLAIAISAPVAADSYDTTKKFYDWFLQAGDNYRKNFSQAEGYFTSELYSLLTEGFSKQPDDGWFLDFDPFSNSQMGLQAASVGKPKALGPDLAMVPVTPLYGRGGASNYEGDVIKVYVKKVGSDWKIANMAYGGDYPFELKAYLKDGLGK